MPTPHTIDLTPYSKEEELFVLGNMAKIVDQMSRSMTFLKFGNWFRLRRGYHDSDGHEHTSGTSPLLTPDLPAPTTMLGSMINSPLHVEGVFGYLIDQKQNLDAKKEYPLSVWGYSRKERWVIGKVQMVVTRDCNPSSTSPWGTSPWYYESCTSISMSRAHLTEVIDVFSAEHVIRDFERSLDTLWEGYQQRFNKVSKAMDRFQVVRSDQYRLDYSQIRPVTVVTRLCCVYFQEWMKIVRPRGDEVEVVVNAYDWQKVCVICCTRNDKQQQICRNCKSEQFAE